MPEVKVVTITAKELENMIAEKVSRMSDTVVNKVHSSVSGAITSIEQLRAETKNIKLQSDPLMDIASIRAHFKWSDYRIRQLISEGKLTPEHVPENGKTQFFRLSQCIKLN